MTKPSPGKPRYISIRWTEAHHIKFMQLGGSRWLRAMVDNQLPQADRLRPEILRAERDKKIIDMCLANVKYIVIADYFNITIPMVRYVAGRAGLPPRGPRYARAKTEQKANP